MRYKAMLMSLLLLVLAAPAFAQVETMQVNVPFAFSVGKKVLPAGQYVVSTNNLDTYTFLGQGVSALALTNAVDSGATEHEPSLIFETDGQHHWLAQIWLSDAHTGHALLSHSIIRLAKANSVEVLAKN